MQAYAGKFLFKNPLQPGLHVFLNLRQRAAISVFSLHAGCAWHAACVETGDGKRPHQILLKFALLQTCVHLTCCGLVEIGILFLCSALFTGGVVEWCTCSL